MVKLRLWGATLMVGLLLHCGSQSKPKYLWIDASANFGRLSDSVKAAGMVDKIVATGFTGIIVDLKPISGEVLYPSQSAPRLTEWKGDRRDPDYDYPAVMIRLARRHGLQVLAALNVFAEGWKTEKRGTIYTRHPEWQTILWTPEGLKPTTEDASGYSAFVNPALSEVQDYALALIREILTRYDFDGIVLDRARYDNLRSDFSPESRRQFELFIGQPVDRFPEDIFTWRQDQKGEWQTVPGPYYQQWLLWRSQVIYQFFDRARKTVRAIGQERLFVTYAGAWYPSYYELGVNWASGHYDPSNDYSWALPDYRFTGYADLLDFLFAGCYFYPVTITEATAGNRPESANREAGVEPQIKPYHTVEGSAQMALRVTQRRLPVYGSLYVQQYKDHDDPAQLIRAIEMLLRETDGVMIFDLVHLELFDWWEHVNNAFNHR